MSQHIMVYGDPAKVNLQVGVLFFFLGIQLVQTNFGRTERSIKEIKPVWYQSGKDCVNDNGSYGGRQGVRSYVENLSLRRSSLLSLNVHTTTDPYPTFYRRLEPESQLLVISGTPVTSRPLDHVVVSPVKDDSWSGRNGTSTHPGHNGLKK